MKSSVLAKIIGGTLIGPDVTLTGVSIDTRTLQAGEAYIAIMGEFKDGHDFIPQAIQAGAVCIVAQRDCPEVSTVIRVNDTTRALQQIAFAHRQQHNLRTVAVTGSCGKTTTRVLLQHILSQAGVTHASRGSFNNHLGVPLTLLQLQPQHEFFVAEIGANHPGEIAALVPLVQPDVAIITNAGPAHLEGFGGTVEHVARAKAEIYDGLSDTGIAVINADDAFAPFWLKRNAHRQKIQFGIHQVADVMAKAIHMDEIGHPRFTLVLPSQTVDVQLSLIGQHNVYNALAAAAGAYALGLSADQIQQGLMSAAPEKHRLIELKTPEGVTIIDDTYNANPLSTEAAIRLLVHRSAAPVLVLGDMRELGENAETLHHQLGQTAKALGVLHLYGYGECAKHAVDAFGRGAFHFHDKNALIETLKRDCVPSQTILVKGSLSMRMGEVVQAMVDPQPLLK